VSTPYLTLLLMEAISGWVPAWAKNEQGLRTQKQLWKELIEILEATSPGVMSNIKFIRN
jgi:hypothetical protein